MDLSLLKHKIQFKYQQRKNKSIQELITITIIAKAENLLSNNIYCLRYKDIIESLEKEDIICSFGQPISYKKQDFNGQIKENDCMDIVLDLDQEITDSQITFKDAGVGIQNILKEQEIKIQNLQKDMDALRQSFTTFQNTQKNSQLDILFLIGMPQKEDQHDVSCEKEIMKIQRLLCKNKIGCSISIVKTKESFKEMLSLNPQIIHVICHGKRLELSDKRKITYLQIEDQKGDQIEITGQQFMKWIQKSNCNPSLIILNACHSQGIYNDMLRVKNNKIFSTIAIKTEFEINDKYAYKFILLIYKKLLNEIKINNIKTKGKNIAAWQKENKSSWQKIIDETKVFINQHQLVQLKELNVACCINLENCDLYKFKKQSLCECFQQERKKEFSEYQKENSLTKSLTVQEYNHFKKFVQLHLESCQVHKRNKLQILNKKYYLILCSKFINQLFKDQITFKNSDTWGKFTNQIDNKSSLKTDSLFLLTVNFLKQLCLEGERFVLFQNKQSNFPQLIIKDHKYQQIVLNGPDLLTNSYPKLSRSKDIHEIEQTLRKFNKKIQKNFSLKLSYFEHSKGRILKYLTDKQSKWSDYKSQIHIFNITDIQKEEQFIQIYLLDLGKIKKALLEQYDNQEKKINLFYFYSWKNQSNLTFMKGKNESIQLYVQREEESNFDKLLFYYISNKSLAEINNQETQDFMKKFQLNEQKYKDFLAYCSNFEGKTIYKNTLNLFNQLIQQKSKSKIEYSDSIFEEIVKKIKMNLFKSKKENQSESQNISDYESLLDADFDSLETNKKAIQDMNSYLLNFIDPTNYLENKPLFKFLLKNIQMNCQIWLQIIQKKSLTRCLLKIILKNKQISQEKLDLLYIQNSDKKDYLNIQSLVGILNLLQIKFNQIEPCLRDLAKCLILDEGQPLNIQLIKSYLVGIMFEKKQHKEFRDIIKIHKRVLKQIHMVKGQVEKDVLQLSALTELENILDYLKVKYYYRIARINNKNLNLYYITMKSQDIKNQKTRILSLMVQSRNIIRTISYIDFKKSSLDDIKYVLKQHLQFMNNFDFNTKKALRRQSTSSPTHQDLEYSQLCISFLIQSTLLKEVVKFLTNAQQQNKFKKEENNEKYLKDQFSDIQRDVNIVKLQILELRKQYSKLNSKISNNNSFSLNQYQKSIELAFSTYLELELYIEKVFHNSKNINPQNQIFNLSLQLNYEQFMEIFSKVNKMQKINDLIDKRLIEDIKSSFLYIQYYFKCSKEKLSDYINESFSLKKYIMENIQNRIIFSTKLLSKSNVEQISKIQKVQQIKKIIIIDEEETDLYQYFNILDLKDLNSTNESTIKNQQQVELLIILNRTEEYPIKQSIFKEKWVLCFNTTQKQLLKKQQTEFLISLLNNLIKNEKVNFPSALLSSLSQTQELIGSIHFQCYSKDDPYISNLCYSNSYKQFEEQHDEPENFQKFQLEKINNYLNKTEINKDLQDILGDLSQIQITTFDNSNFLNNNFQEILNSQSNYLADTPSFPNTYPANMLQDNSNKNQFKQENNQNYEEEEDDDYDDNPSCYSSQLQSFMEQYRRINTQQNMNF